MGSNNPLPPNIGANLAQRIRNSVKESLRAGGIPMPPGRAEAGAAPIPPRPRAQPAAADPAAGRPNTTDGGHRFQGCTAPINITTEIVNNKPLTPEEEARKQRGAIKLAQRETEETRDMTKEQLERLVLLENLAVLRLKRRQLETHDGIVATPPGPSRAGTTSTIPPPAVVGIISDDDSDDDEPMPSVPVNGAMEADTSSSDTELDTESEIENDDLD